MTAEVEAKASLAAKIYEMRNRMLASVPEGSDSHVVFLAAILMATSWAAQVGMSVEELMRGVAAGYAEAKALKATPRRD